MKGLLKKINLKNYRPDIGLLAAWGIPCGIMLLLFILNGIFPFGDRSFLFSDMYHQYMPFFSEFVQKVRAGESLFYSWDVGAGSNFLALYIYYLASPFNWLAFLIPADYLMEFMSYLVVFRIGLCGLTFNIYLRKHFETPHISTVLFSSFYALSGYIAAYNWNIMWLDCVILLPIVLLGLERLVQEGKCAFYCITLALCILTNYYISIMICIFLVLYFGVLILQSGVSVKKIRQFGVYSLLAGGMAAVFLIPAACAMLETEFGASEFPTTLESYFSVLDELARHLMCVKASRGLDHWPNIYCGSAVLLLIPLFVVNKEIPVKRKFAMLGLTGILLLSFSTNVLNFIWHGFNYPNSLPARQSFIYIFLVLVMCYEAFIFRQGIEKKVLLQCFLGAVIFLLFCEKFVEDEAFADWVVMLTLLFVMLYAVLFYFYLQKTKNSHRMVLGVLTFVVVMVEATVNMYNTSVGTVSRSAYLEDISAYQALYEYAQEKEEDFFRVEKFSRTTKNDGTLAGYPTASVFSSTMNSRMGDLYEELGMRHSKVFYAFDGATGLTGAMLNVRYMFGNTADAFRDDGCVTEERLYTPVIDSGNITLYECNYTLPFGYVVPMDFQLPVLKAGDSIKIQNQMVKNLGISGYLFSKIKGYSKKENVEMIAQEDGYYYALLTEGGSDRIEAKGDFGTKEFKDLKKNSILYIGYLKKGEKVVLANADEADSTPQISLTVYRMNTVVLKKVLDLLGASHMTEVSYDSTGIRGSISLEKPGKVMLSVPFEKNWKIMVNEEIVEPELFGECLMMLPLEAGEYDVVMEYRIKGWSEGLAISIISFMLFVVVLIFSRKETYKKLENL